VGPVHWEVRRAGPAGLDAADLRLGPADRPSLTAAALRVDYGPAALAGGHLASVRLSGVHLFLEWRDGRFALRSADRLRFPPPAAPAAPSADGPPVTVNQATLDNGRIHLDTPLGHFLLPFDATLTPETDDLSRLAGRLQLYPRGQPLSLEIGLDRDAGTLQADLGATGLGLARFADLARLVPGLTLDGALDLSARVSLDLAAMSPTHAHLELTLRDGAPTWKPFRLSPETPFRLTLDSPDGVEWRLTDLEARLAAPVPLALAADRLTLRREASELRWDGELVLQLPKTDGPPAGAVSVSAPLRWPLRMSGGLSEGQWTAEIAGPDTPSDSESKGPWSLAVGDVTLQGNPPSLSLSGQGAGGAGTVSVQGGLSDLALDFGGVSLRLERLAAEGTVSPGTDGPRIAGAVGGHGVRLAMGDTRISVSELSLSELRAEGGSGTAALSLSGGALRAGKLRIAGVAGRLPLAWPWGPSDSAGRISAGAIRFGDRSLGSLAGALRRTEAGLGYRLRHASQVIPGAAVDLDGETRFIGADHRTRVAVSADHRIDPPVDLGRFAPAAAGVTLAGVLSASGELTAEGGGLRFPAEISLSDGALKAPAPLAEATGLSLSLPMADLATLRGAPGGRMAADRLTVGAFQFGDLDLRFQAESGPALLVERLGFTWCEGNVEARAFRLRPDLTEFDLLLYADRIHLARFLDQLGAGRAEGEGTVSGRIPVQFREGRFRFSDGVLFSMPGRGGTLHVTGAEGLTAAVGAGTPQGAQLQLALAALESFAYDWARLRLNSRDNALALSLAFNGRPTEPLPFVYQESAGGFVRTGPGGVKSRFQGIQLNLNLNLPLDDLLRYRGIFDMIQSGG
jgi:hypothetical protein